MLQSARRRSAVFLCLSVSSFSCIYFIYDFEKTYFKLAEPTFLSPLALSSGILQVRNDSNAKGFFFAKRDGGRHHKGIDFLVDEGRPILASRSGRVSYAGIGKGYGLYVEILHPEGFSTIYAHLSAISTQKGDWVEAGTIIGLSGRTGNADDSNIKPHLHYEIRLGDIPLNPAKNMMSPDISIVNNLS